MEVRAVVCFGYIISYFTYAMIKANGVNAMSNALWTTLLLCSTCWAQTIEVISVQGYTTVSDVELGADLTLSIRADFFGNSGAGCVFYLAVPSGFFVLAEEVPFSQGELLFGASEFIHDVLPHGQTLGGPSGMDLLAYAVVMRPRNSALVFCTG